MKSAAVSTTTSPGNCLLWSISFRGWAAAQAEVRFLITQDLDFSDVRRFRPGTHHGLLLVRLPEAGRVALTRRVAEIFSREDVGSWAGCFEVLSGHKLRVLRATGACCVFTKRRAASPPRGAGERLRRRR